METLSKISITLAAIIFLIAFACGCDQAQTPIDIDLYEETTTTAATATTVTTTTTKEQETTAAENEAPAVTTPNNWYVEGYVVPDDWIAVMTEEEAFEHYDELAGAVQEGKTIEEIVETLVNRNILVFEIFRGFGFEYEKINDPTFSYSINRITSAPFDSVEELVKLVNGTYTASYAADYFHRYHFDDDTHAVFFEQDGELYVDFNKMYIWSTAPFIWQTYLEFIDTDDSTCTFVWHYITWEYWDYEYNDTNETYSHHNQMTFRAVKENNEWRLTSIILDNPELDISS